MIKEELSNLQRLFKDPSNLENVRLGLSIIQNEKFYYQEINRFADAMIKNWGARILNTQFHKNAITVPFFTYANSIYNVLDYEQNRPNQIN